MKLLMTGILLCLSLLSQAHEGDVDTRGCHQFNAKKDLNSTAQICSALESKYRVLLDEDEVAGDIGKLCSRIIMVNRVIENYENKNDIDITAEHCH